MQYIFFLFKSAQFRVYDRRQILRCLVKVIVDDYIVVKIRFPAFLDKAMEENPLKGEYFLPGIVDQLIQEGKADVRVLKSLDRWYGVTYKEDKQSVVDAIQSMKDKGEYPDKLWK